MGKFPEGFSLSLVDRLMNFLNSHDDLPNKTGSINLKLINDSEIRALNKEFAGIDEATDVLSFPYKGDKELGDVAISLETAQRQATEAGIPLSDELGTLLVHGILHILGLDHQDAAGQASMDKYQEAILKAAGLKYRKMDYK